MREGSLHIKDLGALSEWNKNPTNEEVFVAEWFYDFIFELLESKKNNLAISARKEMIKFTMIYEKFDDVKSTKLVDGNIEYWDGRASYDFGRTKLRKIFKITNVV